MTTTTTTNDNNMNLMTFYSLNRNKQFLFLVAVSFFVGFFFFFGYPRMSFQTLCLCLGIQIHPIATSSIHVRNKNIFICHSVRRIRKMQKKILMEIDATSIAIASVHIPLFPLPAWYTNSHIIHSHQYTDNWISNNVFRWLSEKSDLYLNDLQCDHWSVFLYSV